MNTTLLSDPKFQLRDELAEAESKQLMPTFIDNDQMFQIYLHEKTINQFLKVLFDTGLMSYTLEKIESELID